MQTDSAEFPRLAREALQRTTLQGALREVRRVMPAIRASAFRALPEYADLREQAKNIRNRTLAGLDQYLIEFERHVLAAGGEVHWARTAAEACKIVGGICGRAGARSVIKSKSMVTEEIELNAELEQRGLRVTETDLGEYIIQLRGERPSHILAPALHLSLAEVGATFEKAHDRQRTEPLITAEPMLVEAREELRAIFQAAEVGITGANFLVAETGGVVIVTNEGNADLVASLPGTHIVVTGIEKVVPTLEHAGVLLRLLARSAIGEPLSSYTTLVHGPRRARDTSGPSQFHVVLVDNGRSRLLGTPFQEILRCIRCAACLNHCPVYTAVGGHSYGSVYSGPMGAVLTPALAGIGATMHLPSASTLCGRCESVCPVAIPLPKLLRHWREHVFAQRTGLAIERRGLRLWRALAEHPWPYRVVLSLAAWCLRGISVPGPDGGRRRIRWIPFVGEGWTGARDLAAPDGATFQQRWRRRQRAQLS